MQPAGRLPNFALDGLPAVVGGAGLLAGGASAFAVARLRARRRTGRGTIVAQYEVPRELPPLVAGPVAGATEAVVPAQIVHLAVGGAIRLEDGAPERGFFGPKQAQPVLRVVDAARAVDPQDAGALRAILPSLEPGTAFALPERDEAFGKRMTELSAGGLRAAEERGYFTREASRPARILGAVALGVAVLVVAAAVIALATRPVTAGPILALIAAAGAGVLGTVGLVPHRVHTPLGAEAREHLEGVKLFITVAEADRLRVLQSPDGAERTREGDVTIIRLYERLLPYAVMFGLEREWGGVLETRYAEQTGLAPSWYPAVAVHGLGDFGSTIHSFTRSLDSAASYTSSSSGGSSGGGFAGGGGGGGFSGGR
ncbi:DUF2207 family protein [Leucobacter allii]|uniref:DUF2207 family protein n=1 Tax=Leucobacter allii TaxID=2932247 RepID=UPI00321196C9